MSALERGRQQLWIGSLMVSAFVVVAILSIGWLFGGDAIAQPSQPPTPLHLVGNKHGDRLALTYAADRNAIELQLAERRTGTINLDGWTIPDGIPPTDIMVTVCGRYAHVMAVSGGVHLHTFDLPASFGCDEAVTWLPMVGR